MKCPVCKIEIDEDSTSCHVCGFNELRREFLNISDAREWEQQVLLPYRTKWQRQHDIEPWLKKEFECRAFYERIENEKKEKVFLKSRKDLQVDKPEQIQILNITGRFEEDIDDALVANISKFCNLKEISIQSSYKHRVSAETINSILSVCAKVITLSIQPNIEWSTLEQIDLSKIEHLSVSLQGDVEPICLTANNLKSLSLSMYFKIDLRRNYPRKKFDFSGMQLLEELRIASGIGLDYTSLKSLKNLKKLKIIDDRKLQDLLWLSSDYKLNELRIQGKIKSLNGLEKQSELRYIHLWGNSVSDISMLAQVKQLEYLCLDHNKISDISTLAQLTKLEYISLQFNNISNTDALVGLKKLKYLNLRGNTITDENTLRTLNVPHTILNEFDYQVEEIDRLLEGQVYGTFSGDVYRFIRALDNTEIDHASTYSNKYLIEWRSKSDKEKLMYAVQYIFESKYREMADKNSIFYRNFDHRHRRIYIEKSTQIYPFLKLTEDMHIDMQTQIDTL